MSPIFISAIVGSQAARRNHYSRGDYSVSGKESSSSTCPVCAGILGLGIIGAIGFSVVPGVGTAAGFLIGISVGLFAGMMYLSGKSMLESPRTKKYNSFFNYSSRKKSTTTNQPAVVASRNSPRYSMIS